MFELILIELITVHSRFFLKRYYSEVFAEFWLEAISLFTVLQPHVI